jgi:hypothetical protein
MPEAFAHGIRTGMSPQDKEVGAARTKVFHQSKFYKTNFLNNPNVERAFDPGRNTLTKRRVSETGSIPQETLIAMNKAGNEVRVRQGRAPMTDPRIGQPDTPATTTPANRTPLFFGGEPSLLAAPFAAGFSDIGAASRTTVPAIAATPTPTSSTAVAPVTAKKKQTGSSAAGHGQAQPIKKKKKKAPAQTSARRSALLFDQGGGGLG